MTTETIIRSATPTTNDYLGHEATTVMSGDGSTIVSRLAVQGKFLISKYPFTTVVELTLTGWTNHSGPLALSYDGSVFVATYSGYGAAQYGRVWIRYGTNWGSEIYKTGPSTTGESLGIDVVVSSDGTRVAALAPGDGTNKRGAIFVWDGTNWGTETKIIPSAAGNGSNWGTSLSGSDDLSVLAVGDWVVANGGTQRGRILVYSGSSWATETALYQATPINYDGLGRWVRVSSDGTTISGGCEDASSGSGVSNQYAGRAWVFSGAGWATKNVLTASNAGTQQWLGTSAWTTPDMDLIVLSASGVSYRGELHVFHGANWATETIVTPTTVAYTYLGLGGLNSAQNNRHWVSGAPDGAGGWVLMAGGNDTGSLGGRTYYCYGANWATSTWTAGTGLIAGDAYGRTAYLYHETGPVYRALTGAQNADDGGTNRGLVFFYEVTGPTWGASATLDAEIVDWSPWSSTWSNPVGPVTMPDSFTLDAELAPSDTKLFTVAAIIAKTWNPNFTLNAEVYGHYEKTFTLDAVIRRRWLFGTEVRYVTAIGYTWDDEWDNTVSYASLLAGSYQSRWTGYWAAGQAKNSNPTWGVFATAMVFPYIPVASGESVTAGAFQMEGWSGSEESDIDFDVELYHYNLDVQAAFDQGGLGSQLRNQSWLANAYSTGQLAAHFNTANMQGGPNNWNTFTGDNLHNLLNLDPAINISPGNVPYRSAPATSRFYYTSARYRSGIEPGINGPGNDEVVSFADISFQASGYHNPRLMLTFSRGTGFTLDAEKRATGLGSFLVNAVITKKDIEGTPFTLDAWMQYPTRTDDFALDAELLRTWLKTFTLDAWVSGGAYTGAFALDALLLRSQTGAFTLDALKAGIFTLDAIVVVEVTPPGFTLDAEIGGTIFTIDAWLERGFHLDAILDVIHNFGSFDLESWVQTWGEGNFDLFASIGRYRTIDAIILSHGEGRFYVEAMLAKRIFTLDAVIRAGGLFTASAIIRASSGTRSFAVNAETQDAAKGRFTVNARLTKRSYGAFAVRAEVRGIPRVGAFEVEALCVGPVEFGFTADAQIDSGHRLGSFGVGADILGLLEKRGSLQLDASLVATKGERFLVEAFLESQQAFHLSAWLAGAITLDAWLRSTQEDGFNLDARIAGGFSLDAIVRKTVVREDDPIFTGILLDATVADAGGGFPDHGGHFELDSLIVGPVAGEPPIWLDAVIVAPGPSHDFTLDAFVQPYFALDAWLCWPDGGLLGGVVTLDAYILGNDTILWPEDGGPATDSDGDPIPDWFKASRKYRVNITLDGLDVTGDVIWAQTSFTQNAKTNPGSFELWLRGVFGFDGGEEVLATLDDWRVFGGYVLTIERGYTFPSDSGDPVTVLRGLDFNVLFDKLIVYNKASADDPQGSYTNWRSFKKDTADITIIRKVFGSYVDLPRGFDYTTYVDEVGNAAPEKPWTMPQAGSPLRQVMQSLSQTTNAVWWIDPYLRLHYGSRTTVTAPHPITDGLGGISSQNISMSEDMSMLVTETLLWGTLAYTVEGDIMVERKVSGDYATKGPWQYGEFRTDLHHRAFLDRRTDSIIERYGQPIRRAKVTIFDPGYQAGQVADVRLTNHGLEAPLVIRSLELTFAVAKEPERGFYFAVPRYELAIGLDPEEPWDIYDYLPFPDDEGTDYPPRRGRHEDDTVFTVPHATSWGMGRAYSDFGFHAKFEIHNMEVDDPLTVIQGSANSYDPIPTDWWNYNPASPTKGVFRSPLGGDYTYDSGRYFNPGPIDPFLGWNSTVDAGFASRVCHGDMTESGIYITAVKVAGWEEDIGPWLPQPGHESHTGSPETIVPIGDIELRIVRRVNRRSNVPLNSSSKLVSHWTNPPGLYGYGPYTDVVYDIYYAVDNEWWWGDPDEHPYGMSIPFKVRRTTTSMYEGPPDTENGAMMVSGMVSKLDGWVNFGEIDGLGPWPDLVHIIGERGCPADPVNLNQWWCNLDDRIYGPAIPENRWPAERLPDPNFLFCPYHLGLLFLDGHKVGYIPTTNTLHSTMRGVEQNYPVAPGWGTVGKHTWIPGSAQLTATLSSNDASHDYTLCSGVTLNPTTKQYSAFLRLPVPTMEIETYDWAESSVYVDWRDPAQLTQSEDWCFDWVGKFEGGEGVGDRFYGPFFSGWMGWAQIAIQPSQNYPEFDDPEYPPPFHGLGLDFYAPFRVRMVSSAYGWAIKVWQLGDPMPDEWYEWENWLSYRPERTVGMAPDFQLWQDRSRVGDYATPWADVDIRFICLDYQIVEDTDPLVFGPFYDVPPTGGDIPDMPMRTKELVFGNATDDPEGEIFGAIGDGWNVESLVVADGKFETTARVTRGTLAVYDATGVLQHPVDDWQYDGGDGQHFSLTNTSITRVTVVYRAWVVNLRSEYSVPRLPDPSSIRHRPIPEPW